MQPHKPPIRQYRSCHDSNPPVTWRPFGPDRCVENEAESAIQRKGAYPSQGILRIPVIARYCPVAFDRYPGLQAKQVVDLLRPGQSIVGCDITVPIANIRILLSAGQVRFGYEEMAVFERSGWLLIEYLVDKRPVHLKAHRGHRQIWQWVECRTALMAGMGRKQTFGTPHCVQL